MQMERVAKSFVIENTELENYSMNLVHFFLDVHNYSIFNFEEKILENFNHPYYNIVIVYSSPIHNDVNIDVLLEKLMIIKKNLLSKFLVIHANILIIATNCTLKKDFFELPKNIDFVNATEKEMLFKDEIISDVFSEILEYHLDLSFETLTFKINMLNIEYAKKVSKIFNKKKVIGNIFLIGFLILSFFLNLFFYELNQYFILSRNHIVNNYYFTFLTTTFYEMSPFSLILSIFLLLTLGVRIEKIYGTFRYLLIILLSVIFSNTLVFAFDYHDMIIGFTPIIYTLISSFIYVFLLFRRFLAFTIKRVLFLISFFFIIFLAVLDYTVIYSMIGALIGGFVTSFIIGVPDADNGSRIHRIIAAIFYMIFIILNITFGIK
ncbi:MAG: Rhomboid family [Haloplasmataceae bacterium]|jgi:rhomboid protease GluP|nr:Rhomboid family [Haloplasmataceae bacterium]